MPRTTAVIFDMDGVVVDSVTHKHEHRTRVVREEFGLCEFDTGELIGLNSRDKYEYLVANAGLGLGWREFIEAFDRNIERVYTDEVRLLAGFESMLDWLDGRGVETGLASASNRRRVDLVVDRFDLRDSLDAIVSADDISGASKPDPAIYRHAASLLGADPSRCVAVEDSTPGVTAATDAGMYCLGYRPPEHPHQDLGRADEVIDGSTELHSRLTSLVR